jgi:hypothetical protein
MKEEMVGNSGAGNSETVKRHREPASGIETEGGSAWPQKIDDGNLEFSEGLPSESPESLVEEGDAALRRVGPDSIL